MLGSRIKHPSWLYPVGALAFGTVTVALGWRWVLIRDAGALVTRGRAIYAENCAPCHGAKLEGQPNWKERSPSGRMPAPPHDASGHTWHHSDEDLFTITQKGVSALVPGYGSDMPAFEG